MKKQTAVEWLVSKLYDYPMDDIVMRRIKEAKAMEKEQIIDAFNGGYSEGREYTAKRSYEYYKETYENTN